MNIAVNEIKILDIFDRSKSVSEITLSNSKYSTYMWHKIRISAYPLRLP